MQKYEFIVPLYNCEKFLDDFFISLINQIDGRFTVLICDDCSTDSSLQIVNKYKNLLNINLLKNYKNMGLIFTLNKLINSSNADVLMRIDPDDYISPSRTQDIINAFENNKKLEIFFSDYQLIDVKKNKLKNKQLFQCAKQDSLQFVACFNSPIPHACTTYKSSFIKKYSYNKKYIAAEDFALWSSILFSQSVNIFYNNKKDYFYRVNSQSETNTKNITQKENHLLLASKNQLCYFGQKLPLINKFYFEKNIDSNYIEDLLSEFNFISNYADTKEKKYYLSDVIIFFSSKFEFKYMTYFFLKNWKSIKLMRFLYWLIRIL